MKTKECEVTFFITTKKKHGSGSFVAVAFFATIK
jgi:hypothetical protein